MILLCDDDVGTGVPNALRAVAYPARSLYGLGWGGRPDVWWLERAGQNGWLVFSCNKRMLLVPRERKAIIDNNVGVVYLTNGEETPALMLKVLLNRWHKLEFLDATTPRPFARFLSPRGVLTERFSTSVCSVLPIGCVFGITETTLDKHLGCARMSTPLPQM